MSTRWLLWSLLSPSQLVLWAAIAGALLLIMGRARWGRRLCIAGGAGIFLFGLLPLSHYVAYPLESRFPQPVLPPGVDGIVLLAGAERPMATEAFDEPQLNSMGGRYATALRLAARYPEARFVFTGGPPVDAGTGRLGQTGVAEKLLTTVGLEPSRLAFEQRSNDTCESAFNTKAFVQPRPEDTWVVVTSAMHVPRTVACFRAAGWNVIPQPADRRVVRGGWNAGSFRIADNLALFDVAMHEWLGLAYYRATGRTRELLPASGPTGP